jgi:hypothetical protein
MRFFIVHEAGKAIFINLAHVVKVESTDASGDTLTVRMIDGSANQVTGEQVKELRMLLTNLARQH